eukprot:9973-Pyramimonas_sp.AAC.1
MLLRRMNGLLKMIAAAKEAKESATTQITEVSMIKYTLLIMRPSYRQKKILEHDLEKIDGQLRKVGMDIKKLRESEMELRGKRTQIEILMSDLQRQREEEEAEDDREMEEDSGEAENTRARPR